MLLLQGGLFSIMWKGKKKYTSIWAQVEFMFKNNAGMALAEAMLAISIVSVIFLTCIPLTFYLYENMEKSKQRLHAMIANYDGTVINYNHPSITEGEFVVEGITYYWQIRAGEICSSYRFQKKEWQSCVAYES